VADTAYTGATARISTYAYDTFERPNAMTDPLGGWSKRYDALRGYVDTLITPLTDTVRVALDGRGRILNTLVHGTGQSFNRLIGWTATGELNSVSHSVAGPGTRPLRSRRRDRPRSAGLIGCGAGPGVDAEAWRGGHARQLAGQRPLRRMGAVRYGGRWAARAGFVRQLQLRLCRNISHRRVPRPTT